MDNKELLYLSYERNLQYLNEHNELFLDKNFIRRIIKKNYENLKYVLLKLLENEDFFLELFKIGTFNHNKYNNINYFVYFNKMTKNMKQNQKFLMKLIKIKGKFLKILSIKKILTKKFAIKIIRKYPNLFNYLISEYKKDKEFVLLALNDRIECNFGLLYCMYNSIQYNNNNINLVDEYFFHNLKNDMDIKFKSYNIILKKGSFKYIVYSHLYFSCIKKFDSFEFFKKGNYLDETYHKNIKLYDALIIKYFHENFILHLSKNNNKQNIITYLSNFFICDEKSNILNYINPFFNIVEIFNYKYDLIIYLLKLNYFILKIVKKNRIVLYEKHTIKEVLKINFTKINYILKCKYHNMYKDKNINILFSKAIKCKKFKHFINNNDYYCCNNHITNDYNVRNNKKITNKLFYYISKGDKITYYNNLKIEYFGGSINKIIENREIYKYFCKINPINFIYLKKKYYNK